MTTYNRNAQSSQNQRSRYVTRNYPGADLATTQFVDKLRHSRSMESRNPNRTTSSELMRDVYKTVPVTQAGRMPAANVNELAPGYNTNYSQYSDVNVTAVREAKKREAMAKANMNANADMRSGVRANAGGTRPAPARVNSTQRPQQTKTAVQPAQRRTDLPRETKPVRYENRSAVRRPSGAAPAPAAAKAPARAVEPVNVKFRNPDISGQIAESGPREALYKKVPFPKLAIMILLLSLIFFLMVHSIVKNFEYQREIADLESQLDTLNVRAAELRLELEERDDLAELERRAEEIGMIKSGKVEEKYISLDNSDVIENFGDDEDGYGSFTTMLSAVSRQLSKFLGGE